MSKVEKSKGHLEHLVRLEIFKEGVEGIASKIPDVKFVILDELESSESLLNRFTEKERNENEIAIELFRMADIIARQSAFELGVSVSMWSNDDELLSFASLIVIEYARSLDAHLLTGKYNQPLNIEDLDLSPMGMRMLIGIKWMDEGFDTDYEFFQELVFIFSSGKKSTISKYKGILL